ncbi:MAG: hypothetical protein U0R71_15575 [Solirubrobacterales bacterium]
MADSSPNGDAAAIRDSVPAAPYRRPKMITAKEIEEMPRLRFVKGMESGIFVSKERDGARYYSQGYCFHDADMDDLVWDEIGWDESFLCVKGKLLVIVEDTDGKTAEYEVEEGDHFWAPAGYKYTLRATGVDSINFWTMGPVMKSGWRYTDEQFAPPYHEKLKKLR